MSESSVLQENVLALMCFSKKYAKLVISNVPANLFDNEIYRNIAEKAINFYKKYSHPIAEHLPDVFEKRIKNESKPREAQAYKEVIKGLRELKDGIRPEFVMDELKRFVTNQSITLTLQKAMEYYQQGKMEEIARTFRKHNSHMVEVFDPGIRFGKDIKRTLRFLHQDEEHFYTGVDYLDKLGVVPVRKELFVIVGRPNSGKTMALTHIGKINTVHRLCVAHVSLEMSEDRCSQRYLQAFMAISKRSNKMRAIELKEVADGRTYEMKLNEFTNTWAFDKDATEAKIIQRLHKLFKPHLYIKQFPTGQLTIEMLESYIENLRAYEGVMPDVLIVDYADLMDIDSKNLRVETGKIYQQLRGLAVQYGIAVVTASQTNRMGEDVTTITRKYLAEDYSKVAIADNVLTYNQTPNEKPLGLARIYVDKARNEQNNDQIVIAQNYATGQFCLQSALMKGSYFDDLEKQFPTYVKLPLAKELSQGRQRMTYNLTQNNKRKYEKKEEEND